MSVTIEEQQKEVYEEYKKVFYLEELEMFAEKYKLKREEGEGDKEFKHRVVAKMTEKPNNYEDGGLMPASSGTPMPAVEPPQKNFNDEVKSFMDETRSFMLDIKILLLDEKERRLQKELDELNKLGES